MQSSSSKCWVADLVSRYMMQRNVISIFVLTLAFSIAGCDRRPEAAEARADFLRLYPTTEIISIRMSEDEVVARSFEVTYRRAAETQTKTLNLQYMKNDQRIYEIRPPAPPELP
jgi:hypothetical protein